MIATVFGFGFAVILFFIFLGVLGLILELVVEEPSVLWVPAIIISLLVIAAHN